MVPLWRPWNPLRMHPADRDEALSTLELAPDALPAEIKRAFRRLAMQWHPDRNGGDGAVERFRTIKAAHDYLLRGSASRDAESEADDDTEPGAEAATARRGEDQTETLWLEIEEAIFGGLHVVELERPEPCMDCDGSGQIKSRFSRLCTQCYGSGRTRTDIGLARCNACAGKGYASEAPCGACDGTGTRHAGRRVRVTVPAGMWPGRRLRLAGKAAASDDLPAGDLLLVTRLRTHALFQWHDDALEVAVPVPLFGMLAGGEVTVPVPGGVGTVVVKSGTTVETRLSLPGHGVPLRAGGRGVLTVVLEPVMPEALGKADIDALRALQEALAGRESKLYPSLVEWRKRWIKGTPRKSGASRKRRGN